MHPPQKLYLPERFEPGQRKQFKAAVVQPKTAQPQAKLPVAPAVYRPQPIPKVLQRRTAANQRPPQTALQRKPVAPPVYRPQPLPKVLQTKASQANLPPHPTRRAPAAPPAYRPQPLPKVLQTKISGRQTSQNAPPAQAIRQMSSQAAAHPLRPTASPVSLRQSPVRYPRPAVVQRTTLLSTAVKNPFIRLHQASLMNASFEIYCIVERGQADGYDYHISIFVSNPSSTQQDEVVKAGDGKLQFQSITNWNQMAFENFHIVVENGQKRNHHYYKDDGTVMWAQKKNEAGLGAASWKTANKIAKKFFGILGVQVNIDNLDKAAGVYVEPSTPTLSSSSKPLLPPSIAFKNMLPRSVKTATSKTNVPTSKTNVTTSSSSSPVIVQSPPKESVSPSTVNSNSTLLSSPSSAKTPTPFSSPYDNLPPLNQNFSSSLKASTPEPSITLTSSSSLYNLLPPPKLQPLPTITTSSSSLYANLPLLNQNLNTVSNPSSPTPSITPTPSIVPTSSSSPNINLPTPTQQSVATPHSYGDTSGVPFKKQRTGP